MSVATSTPCIKIPKPSTSSCLRFATSSKPYIVTIRGSQTEGPIRRPVALKEVLELMEKVHSPPAPTPPLKPIPPSSPSSLSSSTIAPVGPPPQPVLEDKNVITLEFQRQKAKELQEYFKQKKLEEANQGPFFGFLGKNEIINGRWAMFGFAVGMLTEYATGSDFVDQVKILLSNFGIIDLE